MHPGVSGLRGRSVDGATELFGLKTPDYESLRPARHLEISTFRAPKKTTQQKEREEEEIIIIIIINPVQGTRSVPKYIDK